MTDLAARIVSSLRHQHDTLAAVVRQLSEDQLTQQSGAAEWTIADTLSHLGSGAEISLATIAASTGAGTDAERPDNQAIWDRWNAASPRDQADDLVEHDQALVELLEGLTPGQREAMRIDMGFLPEPVGLDVAAGMRLNEVTAHAWDVAVGLDEAATLDAEAATLLLDLYAGPLGFLLGFSAKADQVAERVALRVGDRVVVIADSVSVETAQDATDQEPTATFGGATEAAVRLLTGRLKPEHTPAGLEVTGNVTLEDLRKVFPGY